MSTFSTPLVADVPQEDVLSIDPVAETERIVTALRAQVGSSLRRRGLIIGMSGGVDSSVCAALAARAVGAGRVLALLMPERDSDPASRTIAADWATELGIDYVVEDITPVLDGAGCYARRDDAIRRIVPDFDSSWKCKVVLPSGRGGAGRLNVSQLAVQPPDGEVRTIRLPSDVYLQIVAATNFKQRVRKMLEYYHADRLHYAVVGTPNRLEYDQGFFVKGGDGLADVKPIAHLYKTQVYHLADYLGVPASVTSRPPTTDTYSLPQSQEEFYFSLPAALMDRALHARNAGASVGETARTSGLAPAEVERAFRDIDQKRSTTRYLHAPPLLVEPVAEIDASLEEMR